MGLTHVTARISNLCKTASLGRANSLSIPARWIALCRASTWFARVLREGRAAYELANGEPVEYEYGFARISFLGSETVAQVIFGPSNAEPILGVVALENVGVTVDPVTRARRRMHAAAVEVRLTTTTPQTILLVSLDEAIPFSKRLSEKKAMSDVKPPFIRRVVLRDYKSIRECDVAPRAADAAGRAERIGKEQLPGRLAAYLGCAADELS